jgi:hypothetical protein
MSTSPWLISASETSTISFLSGEISTEAMRYFKKHQAE